MDYKMISEDHYTVETASYKKDIRKEHIKALIHNIRKQETTKGNNLDYNDYVKRLSSLTGVARYMLTIIVRPWYDEYMMSLSSREFLILLEGRNSQLRQALIKANEELNVLSKKYEQQSIYVMQLENNY